METSTSPRNLRDCPGCGMAREDWPDDGAGGYLAGEVVYCCRGCAEGPRCTCADEPLPDPDRAPTREEIRRDRASGNLVQSLQSETKHVGPEDYGTEKLSRAPGPDRSHD